VRRRCFRGRQPVRRWLGGLGDVANWMSVLEGFALSILSLALDCGRQPFIG
jgi:hypothetical protein